MKRNRPDDDKEQEPTRAKAARGEGEGSTSTRAKEEAPPYSVTHHEQLLRVAFWRPGAPARVCNVGHDVSSLAALRTALGCVVPEQQRMYLQWRRGGYECTVSGKNVFTMQLRKTVGVSDDPFFLADDVHAPLPTPLPASCATRIPVMSVKALKLTIGGGGDVMMMFGRRGAPRDAIPIITTEPLADPAESLEEPVEEDKKAPE